MLALLALGLFATAATAQYFGVRNCSAGAPGIHSNWTGIDPDMPCPPQRLRTIPAGSLIFPMDLAKQFTIIVTCTGNVCSQSSDFNFKSYGLIVDLLHRDVPVYWCIKTGKTALNEVDAVVNMTQLFPGAPSPNYANQTLTSGYFVVVKDYYAAAMNRIGAYGKNVSVWTNGVAFLADVRYTLTFKPFAGIMNSGSRYPLQAAYLNLAGLVLDTHYKIMSVEQANALDSSFCLTVCTEPHFQSSCTGSNGCQSTSPPYPVNNFPRAMRKFLESGGNFIAQCAGLMSYEQCGLDSNAKNPSTAASLAACPDAYFLTTGGLSINSGSEFSGTTSTNDCTIVMTQPDLAFYQMEPYGTYNGFPSSSSSYCTVNGVKQVKVWKTVGGYTDEFGLYSSKSAVPSSALRPTSHFGVEQSDPTFNKYKYAAATKLPSRIGQVGGNLFYLGGHDYGGEAQSVRMYLNAILMPSDRPGACGLVVDQNVNNCTNCTFTCQPTATYTAYNLTGTASSTQNVTVTGNYVKSYVCPSCNLTYLLTQLPEGSFYPTNVTGTYTFSPQGCRAGSDCSLTFPPNLCPGGCNGVGTLNKCTGICDCVPPAGGNCCNVCASKAAGATCGSGSCPNCLTPGLVCSTSGVCCQPNCPAGSCGGDGCGFTCNSGTCSNATQVCSASGQCVCRSDICAYRSRTCGPSECNSGSSFCGACSATQDCVATSITSSSSCQCNTTKTCAAVTYGSSTIPAFCGNYGCSGASCGTCASPQTCQYSATGSPTGSGAYICACTPNCAGQQCGPSNCFNDPNPNQAGRYCSAGVPSSSSTHCDSLTVGPNLGQWSCNVTTCRCTPTCSSQGWTCGSDGCGGTCGSCLGAIPGTSATETCTNTSASTGGVCVCNANCAGNQCNRDNGCCGNNSRTGLPYAVVSGQGSACRSCGSCQAGTQFCNTTASPYVCSCLSNCAEAGLSCHTPGSNLGYDRCGSACGVRCNVAVGSQWSCATNGSSGTACACNPNCTAPAGGAKRCGFNGCPGSTAGDCGTCAPNVLITSSGTYSVAATCSPTAGTCQCNPNCPAGWCGADGCGGTCFDCATFHNNSQFSCSSGSCVCTSKCAQGVPNAGRFQCGDNGCPSNNGGGTCGACPTQHICNTSAPTDAFCQCVPFCPPALQCNDGANLGRDGCGGFCGPTCAANGPLFTCNASSSGTACVCNPACNGRECGFDGCGGVCGSCPSDPHISCNNASGTCFCTPSCTGTDGSGVKACFNMSTGVGGDGCGGFCGANCTGIDRCLALNNGETNCSYVCNPATECAGRICGVGICGGACTSNSTYPNQTNPAGECVQVLGGEFCNDNYMCDCSPSCAGKQCGPWVNSDGCNGTCGGCGVNQVCDPGTYRCVCDVANECVGRACGVGICGGLCTDGGRNPGGVCPQVLGGEFCNRSYQCDCQTNCAGRQCGPDQCGGFCSPGCGAGTACNDTLGQCYCVPTCNDSLLNRTCGVDSCGFNSTACGVCPPGPQWTCGPIQQCECTPQCAGSNCGPDSCGGFCGSGVNGSCPTYQTCFSGVCDCDPAQECQGYACGTGRCGGSCASCNLTYGNEFCNSAHQCDCLPSCNGRLCGGDGCGGDCGLCDGTTTWTADIPQRCDENLTSPSFGTCVCAGSCPSWAECGGNGCETSFEACGSCSAPLLCVNYTCVCLPFCGGRNCGDDGCGGSCGNCTSPDFTCGVTGVCECTDFCSNLDPDYCGFSSCGNPCHTCPSGQRCNSSLYCECAPDCAGRTCGEDGCGGSCGNCTAGFNCTQLGFCLCQPTCDGLECGPDNCGTQICGTCNSSQLCNTMGQCYTPTCVDCNEQQTNSTFLNTSTWLSCPNNCSGHGLCNVTTGNCTCTEGYSGLDCANFTAVDCFNKTDCLSCLTLAADGCVWCNNRISVPYCSSSSACVGAFGLTTCQSASQRPIECPNDCNFNATDEPHGSCNADGTCSCASAWTGEDCGTPVDTAPLDLDDATTTVVVVASALTAGVIAAIVIGICLCLGIIGGIGAWLKKRKKEEISNLIVNGMYESPIQSNSLFEGEDEEEESE